MLYFNATPSHRLNISHSVHSAKSQCAIVAELRGVRASALSPKVKSEGIDARLRFLSSKYITLQQMNKISESYIPDMQI